MTGEYECNGKLDGCARGFTIGTAVPEAIAPCRGLISRTIAKTDCQGFASIPNTDIRLCKIQLDYPSGFNFLSQGQSTCGAALRAIGVDPCAFCTLPPTPEPNGPCNSDLTTYNIDLIPGTRYSSIGNIFSIGDFNGDGNKDLSIAMNYFNQFNIASPRLFVELGTFAPGQKNLAVAPANFDGVVPSNEGLIGLSKIQDVNGDNIDDLIYHNTLTGGIFVYAGRVNLPPTINPLDQTNADLIITTTVPNANFGQSFAIGPILSGSNGPDIALGDMFNVYVFSQSTINSIFGRGTRTLNPADATLTINREDAGCNFGSAIALADYADTNNPDLVIGDSCVQPIAPLTSPGKVYVFSGPLPSGTIQASSTDITITGVSPTNGVVLENIGGTRDIITGDWNGDGRDDLILLTSANAQSTGAVFIFFGIPFAIPLVPRLTSDADVILRGTNPTDFFGISGDFTTSLGVNNQPAICIGKPGADDLKGEIDCFFGGSSPNTDANNPDLRIVGIDRKQIVGYDFKLGNFGQGDSTDIAMAVGTLTSAGDVHICFGPTFDCSTLC